MPRGRDKRTGSLDILMPMANQIRGDAAWAGFDDRRHRARTSEDIDPDRGHVILMMGGLRVLKKIGAGLCGCLTSALLAAPVCFGALPDAPTIAPSGMPRIGTVDERFQSYNIEMIEITGGRFWKPYRSKLDAQAAQPPRSGPDTPPGMDSSLYQYRPPIDLTNARLRKLAAALAPAYVRISGTWANSTYFADPESAPPEVRSSRRMRTLVTQMAQSRPVR
jgi:hypothetical protein